MQRFARGLFSIVNRTLLVLFLSPALVFAAPVLLWDANNDPNVAGYKVYCGFQSGVYSQVTDVSLQTSNTLSGLKPGITHFFAVTAYTADGLESPFSEEISYTPRVDGITSATLLATFASTNKAGSITFTGRAGQLCTVACSTNLVTWQEVHSILLSTNGSFRYIDVSSTNKPLSFYRVIATPP